VETVSALRLIPNLDVIRPGIQRKRPERSQQRLSVSKVPRCLPLTRQAIPNLTDIPPHIRRAGVLKGGYVAIQETAPLTHIILASGSELAVAVEAAKQLGASTRCSFDAFFRTLHASRRNTAMRFCLLPFASGCQLKLVWTPLLAVNMLASMEKSLALIASASARPVVRQ